MQGENEYISSFYADLCIGRLNLSVIGEMLDFFILFSIILLDFVLIRGLKVEF